MGRKDPIEIQILLANGNPNLPLGGGYFIEEERKYYA